MKNKDEKIEILTNNMNNKDEKIESLLIDISEMDKEIEKLKNVNLILKGSINNVFVY